MRIAFITTEFPPGPMGGIGTYSVILPRLLKAAGHEVVILTKTDEAEVPEFAQWEGLPVYRYPHYYAYTANTQLVDEQLFSSEMLHLRSYVGVFARQVAQHLPALHAKHQFDVVLTQELEAPCFLAQERRLLFNELAELPFVVFLHSPHEQIQAFNDAPRFQRNEYHRILYERTTISLADGWIAASAFTRDQVAAQFGIDPQRLAVIPLPLGDVPTGAAASAQPKAPGEKRLVYAGRLELRKGVETLLQAVGPLLARHPDWSLHLLGRDTDHPTLPGTVGEFLQKKRLPAAVAQRVHFRGKVPRDALWAEYRAADLGVVPSRWEPFSFVCQEMMAAGLPVVASTGGGMAEMMLPGQTGLCCQPEDPAALQGVLEQAITASAAQRTAWGQAARERIAAYCANEAILSRTVAYLEQVQATTRAHFAAVGRQRVPANLPFSDRPLAQPHPKAAASVAPIERVAVVIPCYNDGKTLDATVASVLAQSEPPARLYLVNDGSTDAATLALLDTYNAHPAVTRLNFPNGGLPVARQRGADAALADGAQALVFLDADDELEPPYLAQARAVLNRHPEAGAVTAWTHTIGQMHTYWAPPTAQFPFLIAECTSTPPAMIRVEAFQEAGGLPLEQRYAFEDWALWVNLCAAGWAMLTIPAPLIRYRMRAGSVSALYRASTREHGRVQMAQRHPELLRRYAPELFLLTEGLRFEAEEARHQAEAEARRVRRETQDGLEWNMNEYQRFERLYTAKAAAFDELRSQVLAKDAALSALQAELAELKARQAEATPRPV